MKPKIQRGFKDNPKKLKDGNNFQRQVVQPLRNNKKLDKSQLEKSISGYLYGSIEFKAELVSFSNERSIAVLYQNSDFYRKKAMNRHDNSLRVEVNNLKKYGASIEVIIFPPLNILEALKQKGEKIENSGTKLIALIDPGSNRTIIERNIVNVLKLPFFAEDEQSTIHGTKQKGNVHEASISLPISGNEIIKIFPSVAPVDFDREEVPYTAVIGRDILQYCSFKYDGWCNSFDLTFCQGSSYIKDFSADFKHV